MHRPRRLAVVAGVASMLVVAATAGLGPGGSIPAGADPLASPVADIVVDAGTGRVLIGDQVHKAVHPASTAKILTAVAAVERLCPDATVTADARDAAVETMRIGLQPGKPWPLDQMLASMMMVSANDAAYAIADTVGKGSLDKFAADLTATARRLGMKDSTLNDPAGLDDETSFRGGPLMSAYDLAIATRNAMTVPDIAKWAGMREYSFVDPSGVSHRLLNHNHMLPGGGSDYLGATGFKTGYTSRSQHTLVAAASRNGRTLIAVVLGVPDAGYAEAASLLDAGFATPANAPGTGETLPKVAVSPCANRAADQAAFAGLAMTSTPTTFPAVTVPVSVPVIDQAPLAAATTSSTSPTGTTSSHHSPGLLRTRNIVALMLLFGGVLFLLRRRAVKRQRSMRLARRRQRNSAMRSGGLTVVDGRYRAGTRIGPPVESHVRVRPVRDQTRDHG
jgi:serine-type D-Ala-D-Ala carboxypeptidase (penicillin-binding protein 5/6)